ncbi:MAG: hypothetical protein CMJ83_04990, partial [Planctomycetes bacterium]|nr:hypothetical protein [Planctomycetota bacterium]
TRPKRTSSHGVPHFSTGGLRAADCRTFRPAFTALVTWPVDVWFDGRRTFDAKLDFGGRGIKRIQFDPGRRFPDRNPKDNVWPR